MTFVRILAVIAILCTGRAAPADTLRLDGDAVQGGLIVGYTRQGAGARVNGKPVRVSPEGVFLVGLDRDAPPDLTITVERDGRTIARRELTVARRDYVIQRIDGLPERKVTPAESDLARIRDEADAIRRARERDTPDTGFLSGFAWPVEGRISGVFGSQRILNGKPRQPHRGLDIAAPRGTPVRAMAAGTVILVAEDMFFTGKTVAIDHGHGLNSIYAHLDAVAVDEGARIAKGAVLGTVGQSGRATGPHLHWGVSVFDAFLDPETVLAHALGEGERRAGAR